VKETSKIALQKDPQKKMPTYKETYKRVLRHEKFAFRCFRKTEKIYKVTYYDRFRNFVLKTAVSVQLNMGYMHF